MNWKADFIVDSKGNCRCNDVNSEQPKIKPRDWEADFIVDSKGNCRCNNVNSEQPKIKPRKSPKTPVVSYGDLHGSPLPDLPTIVLLFLSSLWLTLFYVCISVYFTELTWLFKPTATAQIHSIIEQNSLRMMASPPKVRTTHPLYKWGIDRNVKYAFSVDGHQYFFSSTSFIEGRSVPPSFSNNSTQLDRSNIPTDDYPPVTVQYVKNFPQINRESMGRRSIFMSFAGIFACVALPVLAYCGWEILQAKRKRQHI